MLARVQPETRRTYRECLDRIVRLVAPYLTIETFPWTSLAHQHLAMIRQALVDRGLAPSTVNTTLSALRAVLKEMWLLRYIDAEQLARLKLALPEAKGTRLMAGRALAEKEVAAMFQSCRVDPNARRGARDAAMLVLLFYCGMRRAEAASVRTDQLETDDPRMEIEGADPRMDDWGLRVVGKGDKERWIPIPPEGVPWLRWWFELRPPDPGPLLLPIPQWSTRPPIRPLTVVAIYAALKRRVALAGIQLTTPHDLRRTYITDLLSRGVDVATVAKLVGHAQLETTQRYDRRPQASLREAVKRLSLRDGKGRR